MKRTIIVISIGFLALPLLAEDQTASVRNGTATAAEVQALWFILTAPTVSGEPDPFDCAARRGNQDVLDFYKAYPGNVATPRPWRMPGYGLGARNETTYMRHQILCADARGCGPFIFASGPMADPVTPPPEWTASLDRAAEIIERELKPVEPQSFEDLARNGYRGPTTSEGIEKGVGAPARIPGKIPAAWWRYAMPIAEHLPPPFTYDDLKRGTVAAVQQQAEWEAGQFFPEEGPALAALRSWRSDDPPPPPPDDPPPDDGVLIEKTDMRSPPPGGGSIVFRLEDALTADDLLFEVTLAADQWEKSTAVLYATEEDGSAGDVVYVQVRGRGRRAVLLAGDGRWHKDPLKPRASVQLRPRLEVDTAYAFSVARVAGKGVTLKVTGPGGRVHGEVALDAAAANGAFRLWHLELGHNGRQSHVGELPTEGAYPEVRVTAP